MQFTCIIISIYDVTKINTKSIIKLHMGYDLNLMTLRICFKSEKMIIQISTKERREKDKDSVTKEALNLEMKY